MLELKADEDLHKKIKESLGNGSVGIDCKGLDEVTTKSKICETSQPQLGSEAHVLALRNS